MKPAPIGRLAPSPTGDLHVGHARSFLLAWWSARSRGGRVVLRIEDLDGERCRPEHVDTCLRDLEWLGLDWDGAPLHQSRATDVLEDALRTLVLRDQAFACTCSRKDLRFAASAPHAADATPGELRYPGTCRGRYRSPSHARRATGKAAGVRLRVPSRRVRIEDVLHGSRDEDVSRSAGDFLLGRRDGAIAYQLAVVVHDALQGVSEVLRGDDLLPSTPRQRLLQELLGLPAPRWVHVPLVVDDAGERLAKRGGALSMRALREAGVPAERLVRWIAASAGLPLEDRTRAADFVGDFDLGRLPRTAVRFGARELGRLTGGDH